MKRFILIILTLLALHSARAQTKVFEKYAKEQRVETVRVSGSMLQFVAKMNGNAMNVNGVDLRSVVSKLTGVRTLTTRNRGLVRQIRSATLDAYRSGGYEELMQTQGEYGTMYIYTLRLKDGESEFSMLTIVDDDFLTLTDITGRLSAADLLRLTESGKGGKGAPGRK